LNISNISNYKIASLSDIEYGTLLYGTLEYGTLLNLATTSDLQFGPIDSPNDNSDPVISSNITISVNENRGRSLLLDSQKDKERELGLNFEDTFIPKDQINLLSMNINLLSTSMQSMLFLE
jgi:hypothetical protein